MYNIYIHRYYSAIRDFFQVLLSDFKKFYTFDKINRKLPFVLYRTCRADLLHELLADRADTAENVQTVRFFGLYIVYLLC